MKEKERQRFAALYAENFETLYYYAYSIVKDRQVAENLVNDTFLQAMQKAEQVLHHENPNGWLRVALKFNLRHYQYAKAQQPGMDSLEQMDEPPSARMGRDLDETMLLYTLKQVLPPEDYRLFLRYYIDGCSHEELAKEFGISRSASQKRLERIRKQLKRALWEK